MALQKDYSLNDTLIGVALPDAYHKIRSIQMNRDDSVTVVVEFWTSQAVARSWRSFTPWKVVTYNMENFDHSAGQSPKRQLYLWLKTQPDFLSAADV